MVILAARLNHRSFTELFVPDCGNMHGLILETSICVRQNQPGVLLSRCLSFPLHCLSDLNPLLLLSLSPLTRSTDFRFSSIAVMSPDGSEKVFTYSAEQTSTFWTMHVSQVVIPTHLRPYPLESTGTHQNSEVKRVRAGRVLR